jgi:DNA-binding MurR/RpiR family transcriptional regulator
LGGVAELGIQQPYVVITDMRAYSAISRQYCRVATERCIPLALITDVWCPWARDYSIDLLQVKTDTGHFWDSLAPVSCLFNLLLSGVVAQLGDALQDACKLIASYNKSLVNSNNKQETCYARTPRTG